MLSRVWDGGNEFTNLGNKFEEHLYREIASTNSGGSKEFQAIVARYKDKGLEIQKKIKRFITLGKVEYCLYGKLDIYSKALFIEDIKTTSKLMDDYSSKYLKTFQHHLYCYITEIPLFKYFVVGFNEMNKISTTQEIIYKSPSMHTEREIVEAEIKRIFTFFNNNPELKQLYNEKYCLY